MGKFSAEKIKKKQKEIAKEKKELKERIKAGFVRRLTSEEGKNIYRFKETNTKSDFPWEEKGIHYNCGPDNKTHIRCIRDIAIEGKKGYAPVSKCPQCKDNEKNLKGDNTRKKVRAKKRRRTQRRFFEGINLTPLRKYFEEEKKIPTPKKCFGNYVWKEDDDGHDVCEKCIKKTAWGKVCKDGVGYLVLGPKVSDPLVSQSYRIYSQLGHNPFSLKEGHNFEFNKTGEDLNTEYSDINFSLEPFELPKTVVAFMKENKIDWSGIYPKLSVEETIAKMKGVELEEEDDEDEDEEEETIEDDDEEDDEEDDDEYC